MKSSLEHAQLLHNSSGLPVNGDFENGYGDTVEEVGSTVEAAIQAGLEGTGIEDTSGNVAVAASGLSFREALAFLPR
ncbi:MAG TPA: isocitrate lyase/phosphoenolpyruvate mutase family protein [Solirubrobacteraceae bacterium]|nr:isocitrate lyase/phosphoenolpyruvate mutase family protein [Solirubrobacteraceae bacterium]